MTQARETSAQSIRNFTWDTLARPIIALAPMAGYTDTAFRKVVRSLSPNTVLFTEFTSTDGLAYQSEKSFEQISFDESEHPIIVQIFGKTTRHFSNGAAMIQDLGADGIDINMGCPTKNARKCMYGSALLTEPDIAFDIVRKTRAALTIPLSVKTRIGQERYDYERMESFILTLEDLGVNNITLHGRTGNQKYTGMANYEALHRLKERMSISLIGSGDIVDRETFTEKLGTLDGLMIGRGAVGNPWIFQELTGGSGKPAEFVKRVPVILQHAVNAYEYRGNRGLIQFRKHLSAYVKGLQNSKELRIKLMRASTLEEIKDILETARDFHQQIVAIPGNEPEGINQ
jgi:tRNA-dihydrouridine synthase B